MTFGDDDMISRIIICGHIFSANAINNYLLNYDNRCPVCRINLNNSRHTISNTTPNTTNISTSNATSTPTTTTPTTTTPTTTTPTTTTPTTTNPITTPTTTNPITTPTTTTTTTPTTTSTTTSTTTTPNTSSLNNFGNLSPELNNAVNVISNALINEINTNLFGNSQAQLNAEYSFSLPPVNSTGLENQNYGEPPIQPMSTNPSNTETSSVETIRNSSPISTSSTISNSNSNTPEEESQITSNISDTARYITTYVEGVFNRDEIIEDLLDDYDEDSDNDDEDHVYTEDDEQEEKNESHNISRK